MELDVELRGDLEDAGVAVELAEDDARMPALAISLKQFQQGDAVT